MISGILKNSYVDYPKEISFVIFLGGCNFRCDFCHNKSIVEKTTEEHKVKEVLDMLKKRKGFINAVVITGGEPTIYNKDLIDLIKKIKKLGFKIKLDTNGSNPEVLEQIINESLIDVIAMDIKNSFEKYNETANSKVNIENIKKSISIIENSNLLYQFRVTLNKTMHTQEDIDKIKSYLKHPEKLKFQEYKYSKEQLVDKDFGKYEKEVE